LVIEACFCFFSQLFFVFCLLLPSLIGFIPWQFIHHGESERVSARERKKKKEMAGRQADKMQGE
jgi:hypothetical protein